jgi:hypothetical protein
VTRRGADATPATAAMLAILRDVAARHGGEAASLAAGVF